MVILLDFAQPTPNPFSHSAHSLQNSHHSFSTPPIKLPEININAHNKLGLLLSHYPALSSIASNLDHQDLQNLAGTCHQFRSSLFPIRKSLTAVSLRCKFDTNTCVLDLVNNCLKCRGAVCRNCNFKLKTGLLSSRLRRLCPPCQRSTSAASPPFCSCSPDPWLCTPCFRDLNRADEYYRTIGLFSVNGHDTVVYDDTNSSKIRCARGRKRCQNLDNEPKELVEGGVMEVDGEGGVEGSLVGGEDEWDQLRVALDEMCTEEGWGLRDERRRSGGGDPVGGRVVVWESDKWSLGREVSGELRGWCAWCDRVVLSTLDKKRLGLSG